MKCIRKQASSQARENIISKEVIVEWLLSFTINYDMLTWSYHISTAVNSLWSKHHLFCCKRKCLLYGSALFIETSIEIHILAKNGNETTYYYSRSLMQNINRNRNNNRKKRLYITAWRGRRMNLKYLQGTK